MIKDPRIWIPVLISFIIFPVIGVIQNSFLTGQFQQAVEKPINVGIILSGNRYEENLLYRVLNSISERYGINLNIYRGDGLDSFDALVIIGFASENAIPRYSSLIIYTASPQLLGGQVVLSRIQSFINEAAAIALSDLQGIDRATLESIRNPVSHLSVPYIKEKNALALVDPREFISISFTSLTIIIIIAMISILIAQYSAISMAIENEEKTIEVMLTMPIKRSYIILGKLTASGFIGGLSILGFVVGFTVYSKIFLESFTSAGARGGDGSGGGYVIGETIPRMLRDIVSQIDPDIKIYGSISEALQPNPIYLPLLTIYILVAIITMASIGILIGGLSSDVRMAMTLSSNLTLPIIFVSVALAYINIEPGSILSKILISIPVISAVAVSKVALIAQPTMDMVVYLALNLFISMILVYVSGRVLNIEIMERMNRKLSSMRLLRFRR